jgi:hypothetical protein
MLPTKLDRMPGGRTAGSYGTWVALVADDCWRAPVSRDFASTAGGARTAARPCIRRRRVIMLPPSNPPRSSFDSLKGTSLSWTDERLKGRFLGPAPDIFLAACQSGSSNIPDRVRSLARRANGCNPSGSLLQRCPFPTKWRSVSSKCLAMKFQTSTDTGRVTSELQLLAESVNCPASCDDV